MSDPGGTSQQGFAALQKEYFEQPDEARFRWTTEGAGFAELEDEALTGLAQQIRMPAIEIGCGEGNNLWRFERGRGWTGVDRFRAKLGFAARELPLAAFVCADGAHLPFDDGSFGTVLIRDLLHHLHDPELALSEAIRVLRPGGRLILLEPNARNPLVWLQTRIVAAEAGARRFGPELLRTWLGQLPLDDVKIETRVPFPLRRLAFHYRMGFSRLGESPHLVIILRRLEALIGTLLGSARWSTILAQGVRAP